MMATLQAVIDLACGDQVAEVELTIALEVEVIGHTPREHGGREHPDVPEEFELEATLASDVTAMMAYTRQVVYIEDGEVASPRSRSPT